MCWDYQEVDGSQKDLFTDMDSATDEGLLEELEGAPNFATKNKNIRRNCTDGNPLVYRLSGDRSYEAASQAQADCQSTDSIRTQSKGRDGKVKDIKGTWPPWPVDPYTIS